MNSQLDDYDMNVDKASVPNPSHSFNQKLHRSEKNGNIPKLDHEFRNRCLITIWKCIRLTGINLARENALLFRRTQNRKIQMVHS